MKTPSSKSTSSATNGINFDVLNRICDRAIFLALQMIDAANSRPVIDKGEPKVGGHPTACASSQHILGAIHLVLRQPEDYFACKPHVSPVDHAFNYLLHNFRDKNGKAMDAGQREKVMHHLRHYSPEGEPVFQSYHAESDPDSFRYFPSGSVGIPPVNALYTALGYYFAEDHGFDLQEKPTFWCLMGDSEFREGSLMEAMPDAGERELKNLVWIVDYNRQNLDGTRVSNEKALGGSDADRIVRIAEANGWNAVKLKHGRKRERLFAKPGGEEFKRVLDEAFSDFEFQALLAANQPALTRKRLQEKSKALGEFLKPLSDAEVQDVFLNLAGHDLEILVETFARAKQSDKPTLVVAYTIKGRGLNSQAMSGNHSAMPEKEELDEMAVAIGASKDKPFAEFGAGSPEEAYLKARREKLVPGIEKIIKTVDERRNKWIAKAQQIEWPTDFDIGALKFSPFAHTQWMWGQIAAKLDRLAHGNETDTAKSTQNDKGWSAAAPFFVTMAPDVGSSTNTSPNMNGKLYGDIGQEDFELKFGAKDQKAPDIMPKADKRSSHLRFEIAEGNCMSAAGSFGKFGYFTGVPLYPAMPIYDFFIKRAHDQFYYNLYWHSTFATIGTPSGITLAPEGAQHSWKSDFQIPNCITWEPFFAKEVEWILADTLKRHFLFENAERESVLLRCVTKGHPQKALLERLRRHGRFKNEAGDLTVENAGEMTCVSDAEILEATRLDVLEGAYRLIDYTGYRDYVPGDNVVHIFAMGALAEEAIKASDLLLAKGIFANVFVVTSPDLSLGNFAYANGYPHLRETLGVSGDLFLNPAKGAKLESLADWYSLQSSRVPVVSVHDGEPGLLDNIGSIVGVKHRALAVRKTSKSGTTSAIFHLHHLDGASVSEACEEILKESSGETFQVSGEVLRAISESSEHSRDNGGRDVPEGHADA